MANPQKENGHTAIANEILEALARTSLTDGERRVLLVVIRKTYGWRRKQDNISLSQFHEITGLPRRTVCRSLKSLVARMILGSVCNGTSMATTYWFQKDYTKWIDKTSDISATTPSGQDDTRASDISCIQLVSRMAPTKETIQKKEEKKGTAQINLKEKTVGVVLNAGVGVKRNSSGAGAARADQSDAAFLESLKVTYSYLDVDAELRKMDGWLLANPGRKKTRRFIINWLNRVDKPIQESPYESSKLPNKL